MPRPALTYTLTAAVLAANLGTGILCLAAEGHGRAYRLHADRPGPALNLRAHRDGDRIAWRADLPSGAAHVVAPVETASPLIRVDIVGALEQRAGYHEPCDGWSDGHDAIADRLCAAFAEGDVLLVVDSPGGAAAGLQQNVERALAAKAKYERRVTVFADEMIGSAAMWWACAVGDELFVPPAGQTGSIGARGQHTSIKGALDKEGVLVTYFADPPEKVAFAPERLPDETTIERGMRDVKIAADAFRAAIVASPLGVRNGLTPEYLVSLGADMLTGQSAVDAGLADGVESFDAVTAYALALAESEQGSDARETATKTIGAESAKEHSMRGLRAKNGAPPGARAEDDKKQDEEEDKGTEPTGKCSHCGMQNEDDAKFCDQCGKSMAAKRMEEEDDDDDDEDHPPSSKSPPSSERKAEKSEEDESAQPPPPKRMSATASVAAILGASADTPLAIKTAAIEMRRERDWLLSTLAGITGKDTTAEAIGAALNIPGKLAKGKRAAADLAKMRAEKDDAERWNLADRLVKTDAVKRDKVFADLVSEDGKRMVDDKTGRSVRIRSKYLKMDLGTLRGMVTDLEGDAPKKRRDPYEANRDAAREAGKDLAASENIGSSVPRLVNGEPAPADIERAKRHPIVVKAAGGDPKKLDLAAREFVKAAAQNGVSL